MKKAALGLIAVVLASSAVAVVLQQRNSHSRSRVADEWASAIIGVLAANAYGYGPGYNVNPGYAFARGPDISSLAMLLHPQAAAFPTAGAKDTLIAEARGLDYPSQPAPQ